MRVTCFQCLAKTIASFPKLAFKVGSWQAWLEPAMHRWMGWADLAFYHWATVLGHWFTDLSLSWKFEPNQTWLSFFAALGEGPPFLTKKSWFCLMVWKNYILNLDHLLIWAYPENFSKIGKSGLFCWFVKGSFPPFFAKNLIFCLSIEKYSPSTLIIYCSGLFLVII